MKKCINCGFENSDEVTNCQSCSAETFVTSSPDAIGGHIISPAEQRFWERMTFRQFAILFIRFQAIWFLPYVIDDATYLITELSNLHHLVGVTYSDEMHYIYRLLFNISWHIAAFIACIRYAERIASWFIRDIIPKTPPNTALEPTATAPSVSDKP